MSLPVTPNLKFVERTFSVSTHRLNSRHGYKRITNNEGITSKRTGEKWERVMGETHVYRYKSVRSPNNLV